MRDHGECGIGPNWPMKRHAFFDKAAELRFLANISRCGSFLQENVAHKQHFLKKMLFERNT